MLRSPEVRAPNGGGTTKDNQKSMIHHTQIRGFIIDMDGVLWRGNRALPGLTEFFTFLQQGQLPFMLVTNNASVSPLSIQEKLAGYGIKIETESVLTAAQGAAAWLGNHLPPGSPLYVIGEQSLHGELSQAGFIPQPNGEAVAAVVVGFDRQLTWSKLAEACLAIAQGARFVGTNPDPSFPTERGLVPGNGAILAALETATNISPTVIGKPEPYLFDLALARLGTDPGSTLVLGDRLETDILGGVQVGAATALMLTGVTSEEEARQSSIKSDWIFSDLLACVRLFEGTSDPA